MPQLLEVDSTLGAGLAVVEVGSRGNELVPALQEVCRLLGSVVDLISESSSSSSVSSSSSPSADVPEPALQVFASGTEDLLRLAFQILSSTLPPILPQLRTLSNNCSRLELLPANKRSPADRLFAARAVVEEVLFESWSRESFVLESAAIRADSKLPRQENLS
jgi:hypothetical protein